MTTTLTTTDDLRIALFREYGSRLMHALRAALGRPVKINYDRGHGGPVWGTHQLGDASRAAYDRMHAEIRADITARYCDLMAEAAASAKGYRRHAGLPVVDVGVVRPSGSSRAYAHHPYDEMGTAAWWEGIAAAVRSDGVSLTTDVLPADCAWLDSREFGTAKRPVTI